MDPLGPAIRLFPRQRTVQKFMLIENQVVTARAKASPFLPAGKFILHVEVLQHGWVILAQRSIALLVPAELLVKESLEPVTRSVFLHHRFPKVATASRVSVVEVFQRDRSRQVLVQKVLQAVEIANAWLLFASSYKGSADSWRALYRGS
jgi:hypothetical protein